MDIRREYLFEVRNVLLYTPPTVWKGDPSGHIGTTELFLYVTSGECFLNIDGDCYLLREGELAYLPRGKKRTYTPISKEYEIYEMNFSATVNNKNIFQSFNLSGGNYVVNVNSKGLIKDCFEESIEYLHQQTDELYMVRVKNLMIIIEEYVKLRKEAESGSEPFKDAIDYMKKHLNENISLGELADYCDMQPNYFIRKFSRCFNIPPLKYYAKLKCKYAMSLLSRSDISIDEASKMCGIHDKAYFALFFKKHTGITPAAYKRALYY